MNGNQLALYNELRINQSAKRETVKLIRTELQANLRQIEALKKRHDELLDRLYPTLDDLQIIGEAIDAIVLELNPLNLSNREI